MGVAMFGKLRDVKLNSPAFLDDPFRGGVGGLQPVAMERNAEGVPA